MKKKTLSQEVLVTAHSQKKMDQCYLVCFAQITNNVVMLLLTRPYIKFITFLVYPIDRIPVIFFKLGAWWSAKTQACLLRFSTL